MKRTVVILVSITTLVSPATAAPKAISVAKLEVIGAPISAEAIVASAKNIITFANTNSATSDISLRAVDTSGKLAWEKIIDGGFDEIATAVTVDSLGNIWLAGSSNKLSAPASVDTGSVSVENPDGVMLEPNVPLRGELNIFSLWKVSPQGELLATYLSQMPDPVLVNAVSANSTGVSAVGTSGTRPFLISANSAGVFSKILYIGSSKSSLNAVIRGGDGSISVFGASSETLAGKKLVGKVDGILIKVSKTGVISTLVRSSAPKASRDWQSATADLLLTGPVITGNKIESAITKFTTMFVPSWTLRVPSKGSSFSATSGDTSYVVISSDSPVPGINGWKPQSEQLLLISFDKKGVLSSASTLSDLVRPLALTYSRDTGLCGLASRADKSIVIFCAQTR